MIKFTDVQYMAFDNIIINIVIILDMHHTSSTYDERITMHMHIRYSVSSITKTLVAWTDPGVPETIQHMRT